MDNLFSFKNQGKNIEIKLYGDIGEKSFWESLMEDEDKDEAVVTSLEDLNKKLKDNQDASLIDIYINSNGGSIFDGIAIYNTLKRHKAYKRVFIDGFACSVASVIAMCGNKIVMPKTSMMMIHNAWTVAMGNATELRKVAEDLDKVNETIKNAYRSKMKIEDEELTRLMNEETFLSADECYEYGLCTAIDETLDVTEDVEKGMNRMETLYQNKLTALTQLKNAIKDIEQEETEITETEAKVGEMEVKEPTVEENPTEVKEVEEVKEATEVQEIKENALKRFFNFKEEN